ncbi:MAG TPA: LysM peptidoglycan-binding domain-containing protein, partial [Verrucomicrobiae bacterium]
PAAAASGATPAPAADTASGETYTVKSGDNLTTIAKKFGTTPKALRAANGLKTDRIKVGDKLKIPAKATPPPAEPPPVTTPASPLPANPSPGR